MAPGCESKQFIGHFSFQEALGSATSQGSGRCHCPALVGAISTTALGVPVCSGRCQISAFLWALGKERNKVINRGWPCCVSSGKWWRLEQPARRELEEL